MLYVLLALLILLSIVIVSSPIVLFNCSNEKIIARRRKDPTIRKIVFETNPNVTENKFLFIYFSLNVTILLFNRISSNVIHNHFSCLRLRKNFAKLSRSLILKDNISIPFG